MVNKSNISMGAFSYGEPEILTWRNPAEKVIIGKFVSIAKGCRIVLNGEHNVDWITTYPFPVLRKKWPEASKIKGHPFSKGDVVIGNDVWIGRDVLILSGVKINDGTVIAAGSVVTKSTYPYTINGGVPAKFIKKRFTDEQIEKLLKIKWWDWPEQKIRKNMQLLSSKNIDEFIEKFYTE